MTTLIQPLKSRTSTIVPSSATGSYVKVGNMAHCAFNHDNATFTNGTASGNLVLIP